jgi:tetratricopeptide (TPR) repeat protein
MWGKSFEYSFALSQNYRLKAVCMMKFRRFEHLQELIDEARVLWKSTDNKTHEFVIDLVNTQLHIYQGELDKALACFEKSKESLDVSKGVGIYFTHYLIVKIQIGLALIKGTRNSIEVWELLKVSRKLISQSGKFVANLTEAYLLRANIFLLQQKFSKSFRNLQLAISTGEKYNGRLELSRAYFETGKFLSDPSNKYNELNGHAANHYLEKAKSMFEEMSMQWDLEEFRKFSLAE